MMPESITYNKSVVLDTGLRYGTILIEITDPDVAECRITFTDETPINITVNRPHDGDTVFEAAAICSAIYWSRVRVLEGSTPGVFYVENLCNPRDEDPPAE
jgi:hypothetical protein